MKKVVQLLVVTTLLAASAMAENKPRARDLGIAPGVMTPGALNAITDVRGVKIGHATVSGQQLNFPFATGRTNSNASTASQDQNFLMVLGHFNYFGNGLSLGNYHSDSPLSGLGPNF